MDLFVVKAMFPGSGYSPERGSIISGIRSTMWVERYISPSEFTITAPVGSNLRWQLPLGTFISHTDSDVPMMVETHEIQANPESDQEPDIVITGRSIDALTEGRAVGASEAGLGYLLNYDEVLTVDLSPRYAWQAAKILIQNCMIEGECEITGDILYDTVVWHPVNIQDLIEDAGYTVVLVQGRTKLQLLGRALEELLGEYNLGLTSTWRPWTDPLSGFPDLVHQEMRIVINKGVDRSADVVFSHEQNDLDNAAYLWSLRSKGNAAFVVGRWVSIAEPGVYDTVGRRYQIIDGSDIDNNFSATPTGTDLTNVTSAMYARAQQFLRQSKDTVITQAQANPVAQRYTYRKDYGLGDIVMIEGDYEASRRMMVSEYVEIDDETGESGYPTFTPV
jgi:hypothetical protein